MTRRGVISIHDYPEHLNPFREDDEELQWRYNRKERAGVSVTSRLGSPSKSPAKPERPPLPHRTKHKNKENEVASPDEDKYFRQGAKPKKKRPAPMPPSPNQQKMTPAVSDGSLNSTGSTSPNVAEVPDSSASPAKKVQTQSNGTQPVPEKTDEDAPTQNGEHPADITCSSEAKTPSEEEKTTSDNKTPHSEENKVKTDESTSQSEEVKSNGEAKIVQAEETKSLPRERQGEEEKSSSEVVTYSREEAKSSPEEAKSFPEETRSPEEKIEPQPEEAKSPPEEEKSSNETKSTPKERILNGEITDSAAEETKPRNDEESSQKDEPATDAPQEKTEDAGRIRDEAPALMDSINMQDKTITPAADSKQQEGESKESASTVSTDSSAEEAKSV
ncbi:hypothetical protein J437_LFUL007700 [Ladona fulva]|uniref:Uncharacterized protein n=1 Tax=Ladona fulva TaxID=123851 RepID=A0A8K0P2S1_LADFU|nr:hypothetical protein J437_LFUL007700 [Ladona fulva]